jgi:hypothetical protein
MAAMDELAGWLRKQLDDDERVAREAAPGPWSVDAMSSEPLADVVADRGDRVTSSYSEPCCDLADAQHIALWDPARVLAEVDAKRRIIDEAIRLDGYDSEFSFLEMLALPYAGRLGYREAWRP